MTPDGRTHHARSTTSVAVVSPSDVADAFASSFFVACDAAIISAADAARWARIVSRDAAFTPCLHLLLDSFCTDVTTPAGGGGGGGGKILQK